MADSRSKVTLRPRSKLERLLALLDVTARATPHRLDLSEINAPIEPAITSPAKPASSVAPTPEAARVAVRLGYPGNDIRAVARALDAEVPEGDSTQVALRAHRLLDAHGKNVCTRESPSCGACRLSAACSYKGVGVDPALRLETRSPTEA